MVKQVVAVKKGAKGKKATTKFSIDCRLPIEDNIIVLKDFEQFLVQKIKVNDKAGALDDKVTVTMDKESIVLEAKIPFSKRYLKYLKKQELKEYLRVIAMNKNGYTLRYFKIQNEE